MHNDLLFNDKSSLYQSARPTYPSNLYSHLASLCPSNDTVWDCGCGNGQASISLVEHFKTVSATDISEQQIANNMPHERIQYSVSPAEITQFTNNSFDLVCVAQALHWFDFDRFWPEVDRVLKPNGVFAAWGYNFPIWGEALEPIIQELILDVIEPYWAINNSVLWQHYRDVDFPYKQLDSPEFNMIGHWNLQGLFDLIHTFSATRRCMDDIGDEFFQKAFRQAHTVWKERWGNIEQKQNFDLEFVFISGRKTA